jgi:broad specificity phosphatase PhoE
MKRLDNQLHRTAPGAARANRRLWFFLALLAACCIPASTFAQRATTIVIVRHAEKDTMQYDPPLTEAGRERAAALAHVLKDAGIQAIYTTQYIRTQQTAQPLADELGLKLQIIHADADHLASYVRTVIGRAEKEHGGGRVLVVSHGNVIPLLLKELGTVKGLTLGDTEYDNLFVVTRFSTGKAQLLRLRFGQPAP